MMSLRFGSDPARVLRAAVILALTFAFVLIAQIEKANAQAASGPVIFDVRRSLPLEPDEEVTKDFYINAGPEAGFKKGAYISVVRAVPVHDPIKNMQQATLQIPVGKLKVLEVQRGITVARLESELSDDDRPTLEFEGVMVGDHIDLGSITMDQPKKPKAKAKKHIARQDDEDTNPGSAEAMAARNAGIKDAATAPVSAPAPAPASVSASASSSSVQAGAPNSAAPQTSSSTATSTATSNGPQSVEMTTTADVKPDTAPAPATNNSTAPRSPVEGAPKKSQAPKSADNEDDLLERNSFPHRRAADTVRVADYTGAGY